MEKVADFMGTTLDSVIIQACLLQDCFQVLKEWCKPGSLPATPLHAQLTHCGLTLLSLGSWFMVHGMAFCLLRDRHTERLLSSNGKSYRQVVFREMALLS